MTRQHEPPFARLSGRGVGGLARGFAERCSAPGERAAACKPQPRTADEGARGFTLVELIVVIALAGILSFVAATRMNDRGAADARGFADQVASTVRFAQKAAVAQRRSVYVNMDAGARRVFACLDAANPCAQPLAAPQGGNLDVTGPATITFATGTAQFAFDGFGRPSLAAALTLTTTSGAQQFAVTVEPETGYVRRS
ncbi:MAG TPA: type II secretion system protein [Burkholderiaceae bacterium]|nr:type II secretion system protein [Burkholderiaceae bacterium]